MEQQRLLKKLWRRVSASARFWRWYFSCFFRNSNPQNGTFCPEEAVFHERNSRHCMQAPRHSHYSSTFCSFLAWERLEENSHWMHSDFVFSSWATIQNGKRSRLFHSKLKSLSFKKSTRFSMRSCWVADFSRCSLQTTLNWIHLKGALFLKVFLNWVYLQLSPSGFLAGKDQSLKLYQWSHESSVASCCLVVHSFPMTRDPIVPLEWG